MALPSVVDDLTPVDLNFGRIDSGRLRYRRTLGGIPRCVVRFAVGVDGSKKRDDDDEDERRKIFAFFVAVCSHFSVLISLF
jgi:hypothetical protein